MWTAMGHYLALNSNEKTIGRNSAMTWSIYTSRYSSVGLFIPLISFLLGGVFLLIVFDHETGDDDDEISLHTTHLLYGCFAAVGFAANVVLAFLQSPKMDETTKHRVSAKSFLAELGMIVNRYAFLVSI
jgi:hypothetical protein